MVPVLPPGTLVIGSGVYRKIKPDDVVIFRHQGKEKIKRVARLDSDGLFVLGNHAETSTDSRHFGLISYQSVVAKIIYPGVKKAS